MNFHDSFKQYTLRLSSVQKCGISLKTTYCIDPRPSEKLSRFFMKAFNNGMTVLE